MVEHTWIHSSSSSTCHAGKCDSKKDSHDNCSIISTLPGRYFIYSGTCRFSRFRFAPAAPELPRDQSGVRPLVFQAARGRPEAGGGRRAGRGLGKLLILTWSYSVKNLSKHWESTAKLCLLFFGSPSWTFLSSSPMGVTNPAFWDFVFILKVQNFPILTSAF